MNVINVSMTITPDPGPTRMADPNLVRGARLSTGTLIDRFFLRAELVPVGIQIISVTKKIIYIYIKELPPKWCPSKSIHIY